MRKYIYNELKYYILISIMVLASFSVTSFAYSDDNSLYRNDSSSVFAPGYMNAAKYQAESIRNQGQPNNNFMGNMMTNTIGKLSRVHAR